MTGEGRESKLISGGAPARLNTAVNDAPECVLDRQERDPSMTEVKRTYRNVETGVKKAARSVDGTDLKDRVGNAGDEARKDLGNLGDDLRRTGRKVNADRDAETSPEPKST